MTSPGATPLGVLSPNGRPTRGGAAAAAAACKGNDPHAWETAKENYKPLAKGRSAAALKDRPLPLGKAAGVGAAEAEEAA
jgi:hypothetical protein